MTYLTRSKPNNLTHRVTAIEHHDRFGSLDSCDVWTPDGWLVTSAFITKAGSLMGHVRKADKNELREFFPDEFLFFSPDAKAKAKLAAHPLCTPQP